MAVATSWKRVVFWLGVAGVCLAARFILAPSAKEKMNAHSQVIERLLARGDHAEALQWLRGASRDDVRTLGELETTDQSISLVRQIYDAGAREVIAVEIDKYPDGQNTGKLVIALPTDSQARKRVFQWAAKIAHRKGFDADTDAGQTHLFVMLD